MYKCNECGDDIRENYIVCHYARKQGWQFEKQCAKCPHKTFRSPTPQFPCNPCLELDRIKRATEKKEREQARKTATMDEMGKLITEMRRRTTHFENFDVSGLKEADMGIAPVEERRQSVGYGFNYWHPDGTREVVWTDGYVHGPIPEDDEELDNYIDNYMNNTTVINQDINKDEQSERTDSMNEYSGVGDEEIEQRIVNLGQQLAAPSRPGYRQRSWTVQTTATTWMEVEAAVGNETRERSNSKIEKAMSDARLGMPGPAKKKWYRRLFRRIFGRH